MGEVMMIDDSVSQSANYVYCCLTVVAFTILRTGHLLGLTVNDSYLFAGFELADQNSSMAQLTVNICLYSHCLIYLSTSSISTSPTPEIRRSSSAC